MIILTIVISYAVLFLSIKAKKKGIRFFFACLIGLHLPVSLAHLRALFEGNKINWSIYVTICILYLIQAIVFLIFKRGENIQAKLSLKRVLQTIGLLALYSIRFRNFSLNPDCNFRLVFSVLACALIVSIAEEVVFRSMPLSYFLKKADFDAFFNLNWSKAVVEVIVISSLLFALTHLDFGTAFISKFIFSMFAFILYALTGKLSAPIIMHFLNNTLVELGY